jgi:hypothetical protein
VGIREARLNAVLVRSSGAFTRLFELKVVHHDREVRAFERKIGETLPMFCPERHINSDGSFCLGLRAGEGLTDETAPAWWKKLQAFLLWLETAAESGLWPAEAQISHGVAGETELSAERAANEIGVYSAYREAVEFDAGLIAASLSKINQATGLLRNGRSRCVCGRKNRRENDLLRRECHRRGCPIVLEHRRRAEVAEFWHSIRDKPCCGTMQDCPLRSAAAP